MGEPSLGMTIERKNNDGDYEPNNCIWTTQAQQARNRESTIWVVRDGKRMVLFDARQEAGIPQATYYKWKKRLGSNAAAVKHFGIGEVKGE
jgi:hypothetical protein